MQERPLDGKFAERLIHLEKIVSRIVDQASAQGRCEATVYARLRMLALLITLERDLPEHGCREIIRVYRERLEDLIARDVEAELFT